MTIKSTLRVSVDQITGDPADVEILVPRTEISNLTLQAFREFFNDIITDSLDPPTNFDEHSCNNPVEYPPPWVILLRPSAAKLSPLHALAEYLEHITVLDPQDPRILPLLMKANLEARSRGLPVLIVSEIERTGVIEDAHRFAKMLDCSLCGVVTTPIDPGMRYRSNPNGASRSVRDAVQLVDFLIVPNATTLSMLRPRLSAISGMMALPTADTNNNVEREVLLVIDGGYTQWRADGKQLVASWRADAIRACRAAKVTHALIGHDLDRERAHALNVPVPGDVKLIDEIRNSRMVVTSTSDVAVWAAAIGRRSIYFNPIGAPSLPLEAPLGFKIARTFRWQDLRDSIKSPLETEDATEDILAWYTAPQNDVPSTIASIISGLGNLHIVSKRIRLARQPTVHQGSVVIWSRMPRDRYSGGRYHAWMMAEALAHAGYEVAVVTDGIPLCWRDFQRYPNHHKIDIISQNDHLRLQNQPADVVFLAPGMELSPGIYCDTVRFAARCGARLGLINFETPNWYNALSPTPRDDVLWENWYRFAAFCSVILSSTAESVKFAKVYYGKLPKHGFHDYVYAGINTEALTCTEGFPRDNHIALFFPRIGNSEHKGSELIPQLITNRLRGATLSILCGAEPIPQGLKCEIERRSAECGISVEYHYQLTDHEKFTLLRRCRMLLFPSMFEGYGYPPIEALAAGTKCVAFDLPVLRETCLDFLRYAPHGDWVALANAAGETWNEITPLASDAIARANRIAGFENYSHRLAELFEAAKNTPHPWGHLGDLCGVEKGVNSHFLADIVGLRRQNTMAKLFTSLNVEVIAEPFGKVLAAASLSGAEPADMLLGLEGEPRLLFIIQDDPETTENEAERLAWETFLHARDQGYMIDVVWLGQVSPIRTTELLGYEVRCICLDPSLPELVDTEKLSKLEAAVASLPEFSGFACEKLAAYVDQARSELRCDARSAPRDDLMAMIILLSKRYNYDAIVLSRRPGFDQIEPLTKTRDRPLLISTIGRQEVERATGDRRADYHLHYAGTVLRRSAACVGISEDPWILARLTSARENNFDQRGLAIIADPVPVSYTEAGRFLSQNAERLLRLDQRLKFYLLSPSVEQFQLAIPVTTVNLSISAMREHLPALSLVIDFSNLAGQQCSTKWIGNFFRLAEIPTKAITLDAGQEFGAAMQWADKLLSNRQSWAAASKRERVETAERCGLVNPFEAFDAIFNRPSRQRGMAQGSSHMRLERQEEELTRATEDKGILVHDMTTQKGGVQVLWAVAARAIDAGELELALECVRAARRIDPSNIALLHRYVGILVKNNLLDDAQKALYLIASYTPLDVRVYAQLITLTMKTNSIADAMTAAQTAIRLESVDSGVLSAVAAALSASNEQRRLKAWVIKRLDKEAVRYLPTST